MRVYWTGGASVTCEWWRTTDAEPGLAEGMRTAVSSSSKRSPEPPPPPELSGGLRTVPTGSWKLKPAVEEGCMVAAGSTGPRLRMTGGWLEVNRCGLLGAMIAEFEVFRRIVASLIWLQMERWEYESSSQLVRQTKHRETDIVFRFFWQCKQWTSFNHNYFSADTYLFRREFIVQWWVHLLWTKFTKFTLFTKIDTKFRLFYENRY